MMYAPLFNHVLVEVDDTEAAWGGARDESAGLLGASFNKGKLVDYGLIFPYGDSSRLGDGIEYIGDQIKILKDKPVMWHKGHEGDSVFEHDGKKYALLFWWDLVGVGDDDSNAVVFPDQGTTATTYAPGSKEDDVQRTRDTLRKHGVKNADDIRIEGGGPDTDHITGIR